VSTKTAVTEEESENFEAASVAAPEQQQVVFS